MNKYTLRPIEDDDHEWLVDLHNDPLVLKNVTDPRSITLESHMKWWNEIKESSSEERFIFCINGIRAGIAKLYKIDQANKSCKLGADLHESFRGQGHAKFMWKLMLERCFEVHGLNRVALTTAEYNAVGNHLYKSLGFKEEGKKVASLLRDGQFFDQICMFLLRHDFYEKNSPDR
jgi:diamine N-acetyltransferase